MAEKPKLLKSISDKSEKGTSPEDSYTGKEIKKKIMKNTDLSL